MPFSFLSILYILTGYDVEVLKEVFDRLDGYDLQIEVGEVLDTIKKAANEGYTMLLVSHEMNFVKNVATRVIFLENGKIIEDGPPKEVFNHPKSDRVREFFAKINRMVEPEYSI